MYNTRAGFFIGSGIAAGIALIYAVRRRRRHSILARARKQAIALKKRATKLPADYKGFRDSASDFIGKGRDEALKRKKGIIKAIGAGKAAYERAVG